MLSLLDSDTLSKSASRRSLASMAASNSTSSSLPLSSPLLDGADRKVVRCFLSIDIGVLFVRRIMPDR